MSQFYLSSATCLALLPVVLVLVLRIWYCLHHWSARSRWQRCDATELRPWQGCSQFSNARVM